MRTGIGELGPQSLDPDTPFDVVPCSADMIYNDQSVCLEKCNLNRSSRLMQGVEHAEAHKRRLRNQLD